MDLVEYQKLKQRRRSLEDKFKQGDRSQELIKELESISKTLEDDPPTVETLYGAIGQSRETVDMTEREEGDESTEE
jgi:hypothetical protein